MSTYQDLEPNPRGAIPASPRKSFLNIACEWALPLLLGVFVIVRCIVYDSNRRLWCDELLSWYPANASVANMLSATTDTINSAPPLYFILTWFWTGICGDSPLALRLFSAIAAATTIWIVYYILQRAFGKTASLAALVVAFSNSEFLYQSSEARFHSLLVAEVALALLLYQKIVARPKPSRRLLILNTLVHAAIVMTHYLGPLYSAAILGGLMFTSISRKFSILPPISIVASWLVFIPWLPVFIRHSGMGKPFFWIPIPSLENLTAYYLSLLGPEFWLFAKLLLTFGAVLLLLRLYDMKKKAHFTIFRIARPRETPLLLAAVCLLLVPVVVYFFSTRPGGTSVFSPRYFVPCSIGTAILYAFLANRVMYLNPRDRRKAATTRQIFSTPIIEVRLSLRRSVRTYVIHALQLLIVATAVVWCGVSKTWAVNKHAIGREPRPVDIPANYTPGEPVVIEHIHEFLKIQFFAKDPSRYVFAIDPEVGQAERGGGPLNHQIMTALARQFPKRFHRVMTTDEFLDSHRSFWVKRGGMLWFALRIENNPHFGVDKTEDNGSLLHVRRVD